MDWIHLHYQRAAPCQTAEITAWWSGCTCASAGMQKIMSNVKRMRGKRWREDSVVYMLQLLTAAGEKIPSWPLDYHSLSGSDTADTNLNPCLVRPKPQQEMRHTAALAVIHPVPHQEQVWEEKSLCGCTANHQKCTQWEWNPDITAYFLLMKSSCIITCIIKIPLVLMGVSEYANAL